MIRITPKERLFILAAYHALLMANVQKDSQFKWEPEALSKWAMELANTGLTQLFAEQDVDDGWLDEGQGLGEKP